MCSGPAYLVAFGKTTPLNKSKSPDRAAEDPSEAELDDAADVRSEMDDTADAVSKLDDVPPCTGCGRIPCDCDRLEAAHLLLWFPETTASGNPSGSPFGSPSGGAFGSPSGSASGGRSLLSLRAPVHVTTETFLVSSSVTFCLIYSFHGINHSMA